MNEVLYATTIIVSLVIAYQDFKYRANSWFLFPILFIQVLIIGLINNASCKEFFLSTASNIFILVIQFLVVKIYFSVRKGRGISIVDHYLGLGDVLFLVIFSFAFSTFNFLLVYLVSLVIALIGSTIFTGMKKMSTMKIPLAGYFSLILISMLVLKLFSTTFSTYDDTLTRQYLYRWTL